MNVKNRVFYAFYMGVLGLVSLAFVYLISPFFTAVFWSVIFAILFQPVYLRLYQYSGQKYRNTSAFLTVLFVLLIGIIPIGLILGTVTKEAVGLYNDIQSGKLNLGGYVHAVYQTLPPFIQENLEKYEITDMVVLREKLSAFFQQASKVLANEFVKLSQVTLRFLVSMGIMLYLLFFFLRDGEQIKNHIKRLVPLSYEHKLHLFDKFLTVVRATMKGNVLVALVQGSLGGFIFLMLGIQAPIFWGLMMAILSLLPAVGAALIWAPVALYFLVTGNYAEGGVLVVFGVFVIGLADNVLRPLLVGKDTELPDYLILVSTIGGISAFGINGFVIGPLIAALAIAFWDELPNASRLLESALPSEGKASVRPEVVAKTPQKSYSRKKRLQNRSTDL